jgi:hypothetical protein
MIYPAVSPVKLIGSLVYRTNEALNKNGRFMEQIRQYEFYDSITEDGRLHLWHYPGTVEEISHEFLTFDDVQKCRLRFPAVFNYQGTRQRKGDKNGFTTVTFNLAFVTRTGSGWSTNRQDNRVYDLVLRDVCAEFMKQAKRHPCIFLSTPEPPCELYDGFLNESETAKRVSELYYDYLCAIQAMNLQLPVRKMCERELTVMKEESDRVT